MSSNICFGAIEETTDVVVNRCRLIVTQREFHTERTAMLEDPSTSFAHIIYIGSPLKASHQGQYGEQKLLQ